MESQEALPSFTACGHSIGQTTALHAPLDRRITPSANPTYPARWLAFVGWNRQRRFRRLPHVGTRSAKPPPCMHLSTVGLRLSANPTYIVCASVRVPTCRLSRIGRTSRDWSCLNFQQMQRRRQGCPTIVEPSLQERAGFSPSIFCSAAVMICWSVISICFESVGPASASAPSLYH